MSLLQNPRVNLDQKSRKKPYIKPQLQAYGDLRKITQSISGTMSSDGGSGTGNNMNRTS